MLSPMVQQYQLPTPAPFVKKKKLNPVIKQGIDRIREMVSRNTRYNHSDLSTRLSVNANHGSQMMMNKTFNVNG